MEITRRGLVKRAGLGAAAIAAGPRLFAPVRAKAAAPSATAGSPLAGVPGRGNWAPGQVAPGMAAGILSTAWTPTLSRADGFTPTVVEAGARSLSDATRNGRTTTERVRFVIVSGLAVIPVLLEANVRISLANAESLRLPDARERLDGYFREGDSVLLVGEWDEASLMFRGQGIVNTVPLD